MLYQDHSKNVTVYLAEHSDTEDLYAWSVHKDADKAQMTEANKEVSGLLEAWTKNGDLHVISPLIEGESLANSFKQSRLAQSRNTIPFKKSCLVGAIKAVEEYHKRGLYIGEMNLRNILKTRTRSLFVKHHNQILQHTNGPHGFYAIPSITQTSQPDVREDILAIAAIAIDLFRADDEKVTERELKRMKEENSLPSIVQNFPDDDVKDFILKCQYQYKTASDLNSHQLFYHAAQKFVYGMPSKQHH